MAQIFPRRFNRLPPLVAAASGLGAVGLVAVVWYTFSPLMTDVGHAPRQPVPFSHRTHAGDLDVDCRYCHNTVERAAHAAIPPTQTCMNCHHAVLADDPRLAPLRDSARSGLPIAWVRVHKIPDYAFFDHAVHVSAGVGCASCHGRIDQMKTVRQVQPLSMGWCLSCHRDPAPSLRPLEAITRMDWTPPAAGSGRPEVAPPRRVQPPTHCSACHH